MKSPSRKTIKQLFAKSHNQCAFPECTVSIVDNSLGIVIGEVCHIKAQNVNGPRYDSEQSDQERNSFENLILLCPTHHTIIDSNVASYTVARLHEMKTAHEDQAKEDHNVMPEEIVSKLISTTVINRGSINNSIILGGDNTGSIIQNITTPVNLKEDKSYQNILEGLYSGEKLSKCLSEVLQVASKIGDSDLVDFCKNELSGWTDFEESQVQHRLIKMFVSPYPITNVYRMDTEQFWKELERREEFHEMQMLHVIPVFEIEQSLHNHRHFDLNTTYTHQEVPIRRLFPDAVPGDVIVHVYGKGNVYEKLLASIKSMLSKLLLNKIQS